MGAVTVVEVWDGLFGGAANGLFGGVSCEMPTESWFRWGFEMVYTDLGEWCEGAKWLKYPVAMYWLPKNLKVAQNTIHSKYLVLL